MNLAALDQYLALRLIDAPLSMFEGDTQAAARLSSGARTRRASGRESVLGPRAGAEARAAPRSALLDELEARIEEALRLHMVSDVPVGAFLSGGMDSSLLVAMLNRKLQRGAPADVHRWARLSELR